MRPLASGKRRRIILLSPLLAAAAMGAVWALVLTASASAAPRIVCPLSSPKLVSCCPLPPQPAGASAAICCPPTAGTVRTQAQPICCTTTCCTGTCCAPTLCGPGSVTIAASPDPSRAGQKVVISGAVAGTSVSAAQVVLWRKLAHQSSFQQDGQTTTDSGGNYTFTLGHGTVMADQEWYVTSGGMQSATVEQHVDAVVGLTSSARSVVVGQAIVLRGHVTPSHAGEVLQVEMSHGAAWRLIARPRLGHGSNYRLSRRFTLPGTVRLRVIFQGDSRNERSISRTLTVSVKQ